MDQIPNKTICKIYNNFYFSFRGVHLFVLVHGFQGNSCDMRLLKNNLSLMHPDAIFLVSSANED